MTNIEQWCGWGWESHLHCPRLSLDYCLVAINANLIITLFSVGSTPFISLPHHRQLMLKKKKKNINIRTNLEYVDIYVVLNLERLDIDLI